MEFPKLIFKYKSLSGVKSRDYTLDILKNHRLFLPKRCDLNDPMEGCYTPVFCGIAGASIYESTDEESYFLKEERDKYKILSFSATCFSPQMWAYYTDSYTGICVGFKNTKSFKNLTKVKYTNKRRIPINNPIDLDSIVRADYRLKHIDWSHEREWRIIKETEEDYLYFSDTDIACIIVGLRTNISDIEEIKKLIPKEVPIFRAVVGSNSFRIRLLELEYQNIYDGTVPPFINSVRKLDKYISKRWNVK